ncbi:hypothetical protein GCM10027516_24680 [Niabella aquatica]
MFATATVAQVPNSENFDGIPTDGNWSSWSATNTVVTVNDWLLSAVLSNGSLDPDGGVDFTNNSTIASMSSSPADGVAYLWGGVTALMSLKPVSGSAFQLLSIRVEQGDFPAVCRVLGYKNGSIVATSESFTAGNDDGGTLVTLGGATWGNIDEFRIERISGGTGTEGDYFDIFLDDVNVTAPIALPVNFGIIEASLQGNQLQVNWTTLHEANNDYFEVQASKNGIDFNTMATVKSQAGIASTSSLQYVVNVNMSNFLFLGMPALLLGFAGVGVAGKNRKKYRLMLALGIACILAACAKETANTKIYEDDIYVRIAQTDIDGTTSYSKIVKVIQ